MQIDSNSSIPKSQTLGLISHNDSGHQDYALGDQNNEKNYCDQFIKFNMIIQDSGIGIAPENLDKLFLNFGKLDEHQHINSVGTGLGLSICKQLIE